MPRMWSGWRQPDTNVFSANMLWPMLCCRGKDTIDTVDDITDEATLKTWEDRFTELRKASSQLAPVQEKAPVFQVVSSQPVGFPSARFPHPLSEFTVRSWCSCRYSDKPAWVDRNQRKRPVEDANLEVHIVEPAPEPCTTEKTTSESENSSVAANSQMSDKTNGTEDSLTSLETKRKRPTLGNRNGPAKPFVNKWQAVISKVEESGRLGLEIAARDNTLRVESVGPDGPMVDWNSANPDKKVEVGDFVISVNGHSGPATSMLEEAQRASTLRLTITRAGIFFVTVNKCGALGTTFGVFTRSLVVKQINHGPIKRWNEENLAYAVQPGDLILEVNGIRDNSLEMLAALKLDGVLRMQIQPLGGAGF